MSKFDKIVEVLAERVRRGEYLTRTFPPERELAVEMNVSRMTARKAVLALVDTGVLERLPNGRIQPKPIDAQGKPRKHVSLLLPAGVSLDHQIWEQAIIAAAEANDITVHPHVHTHPSAMLVQEAADSFDGVFVLAESLGGNESLLTKSGKPVFALGNDLSDFGIPSIQLFPVGCGAVLLDHLYELGHRKIAFLSTGEECDEVLNRRARDWEDWMKQHPDCTGQCIRRSADWSADRAELSLSTMNQILGSGHFEDTALLCATVWMAMGAMKALRQHGRTIGKDVSICTFNGERIGRWFAPSITSLEMPDPAPLLERCMDVVRKGKSIAWRGALLRTPGMPALFKGESTSKPKG